MGAHVKCRLASSAVYIYVAGSIEWNAVFVKSRSHADTKVRERDSAPGSSLQARKDAVSPVVVAVIWQLYIVQPMDDDLIIMVGVRSNF